jgi:hypothetical protein
MSCLRGNTEGVTSPTESMTAAHLRATDLSCTRFSRQWRCRSWRRGSDSGAADPAWCSGSGQRPLRRALWRAAVGSGERVASSSKRTRRWCRSCEQSGSPWMGMAGPWVGSLGLSTGFLFLFFICLTRAGNQLPPLRPH